MSLAIYDADNNPINQTLHAYVDGVSGGVYEFKIFVKNDEAVLTHYYTGVQLEYLVNGLSGWYDPATSRLNVRMYTPSSSSQSGTRPSALDWQAIEPSDTLALPDIGRPGAPTNIGVPVWIRVFVPGNTDAQTLSHGLRVTGTELVA